MDHDSKTDTRTHAILSSERKERLMQCLCGNQMEPWGSGFGSRDTETRIWRCGLCGRLRLCIRHESGHYTERFYRREDPPDTCSRRHYTPIDLDLPEAERQP